MNPEKCGYHVYYDGVKTKTDFLERGRRAVREEHEEVLLFLKDETIQGMILFFWEPDQQYLQTIGFNIATETDVALSEFLDYLNDNFSGNEVYLGYPKENETANRYHKSQGFEYIQDDYNTVDHVKEISPVPVSTRIIPVTKENYHLFQILHSQIQGELYWNSGRILEHLDTWTILVFLDTTEPVRAVYYRHVRNTLYEIFDNDFGDVEKTDVIYRQVPNAAVIDIRNPNGEHIFFFCDEELLPATTAAGFTFVGRYLCCNLPINKNLQL